MSKNTWGALGADAILGFWKRRTEIYEIGRTRWRLQVRNPQSGPWCTKAMLTSVMVDSARYAFASQLAVLRSCPDVISRLLKSGGSVLLAAKVLVISRLLHTKLSQRPNPPPYLENLRNKLGSLRRKLLGKIDRRFKSLGIARDVLVEALCAFALATSSSSKDVLRHFHHVRQESISESMDRDGSGHEHMLHALKLYVKTLRDTQAMIPNQLTHALEKLKSIPLFKNHDVYSIVELNLDVHERWIADDIKPFTPYIRADDLSKTEAERSLKQWAKAAFSSFLQGLRKRVDKVQDPLSLIDLRQSIIELWLSNHQHSTNIDSADTLDSLRGVFNLQAIHIVQVRTSRLDRVSSVIQDVLQDWQPGVSDLLPSLWDPSITSMNFSSGGKHFRETLTARSFGETEPLTRASHEYKTFLQSIEAVEETIKKLRENQWTDDIDDVGDEDDLLDNKQVLLSEDDPRLLQVEMSDALDEAYRNLQNALGTMHPFEDDKARLQKCCFLIRVWRELRQHLPKSYDNQDLGLEAIPTLQGIIADENLRLPIERFSKQIGKTANAGTLVARPLWEGDPALPVLPSQWTYRFLLDVVASMTKCGSDIWSPQATDTIKQRLNLQVAHLLEEVATPAEHVNGHINGTTDADGPEEGKEEEAADDEREEDPAPDHASANTQKTTSPTSDNPNGALPNGISPRPTPNSRDKKIQILFDTSYLINAATTKNIDSEVNKLISFRDSLVEELALETKSVQRIKKDAGDYWKRTSLLFGLLA